jgi:amidase
VKGLRIGILEEGFAEPIEPRVAEGVVAAISTLENLGAEVTKISIPKHAQIDRAYAALVFEGARAIHNVGFFGIGAKSYYPASIIAAVDRMWREHGDMMPAHARLSSTTWSRNCPDATTMAARMPRRTTQAGLCGRVRPRHSEG